MNVEVGGPQRKLDVPARFLAGVQAVEALAAEDRYLAALVFGSVAEGTATMDSDLDVRVVVDEENACANINHPRIGGVKLDITFQSQRQLEREIDRTMRDQRRAPMIAGAVVVFDKTGAAAGLVARADAAQRPAYDPAAAQLDQFMLYHANDKVQRALSSDPESSLYSMHATIGSVLEIHYRVHARQWVSSKKLFADLQEWDRDLASLLRRFVAVGDVQAKFELWTQVVDRVAASFGGRQPIEENLCDCAVCIADLRALQAGSRCAVC